MITVLPNLKNYLMMENENSRRRLDKSNELEKRSLDDTISKKDE